MLVSILNYQITRFDSLLENAPTRDPDEPEKDFGLLRIEDEIRKLRLTPAEKEQCISDWTVGFSTFHVYIKVI